MNRHIIEINGLYKSYGNTAAVNGISFKIEKGALVSLLGPNGAGKTTTLECMEGLIDPDGGSIEITGEGKWRDAVGIQLQASALPETMTVEEAMKLFCTYRRIPAREDLLHRFGLEEKKQTQYRHLSTGQKRRLALALALIHNPAILFLDEPTAGLDVPSRIELHRIIRELKEAGTTIILATHDMAEAETLSDKIIIMISGRVAAEGSPAEITAAGNSLTRISLRTVTQFSGEEIPRIAAVEKWFDREDYLILFSSNITLTISSLLKKVEAEGNQIIDLRIERPSLEERFMEITGYEKQKTGVTL